MKLRLGAAGVGLLALAFYVVTLQPSLSWGDGTRVQREALTGESFLLAAMPADDFAPDSLPFARLGAAAWDHPLYVMIAHTALRLLPRVEALWLVNLHSAIFGAATVSLAYLLCRTHTGSTAASLLAALWLAVSHTFWFHSVTPEVYSLFTFLLLLAVVLYDGYERTGRPGLLAGSLLALGLSLSTHLMAALALPAGAAYYFLGGRGRRTFGLEAPRAWLLAAAFLVGWSPYWAQLLRMARAFPLARVLGPVIGESFVGNLPIATPADALRSLANYGVFLALQFGPLGVWLGAYGLAAGAKGFRALWQKVAALYAAFTLFGLAYRVTDQFAFFMGSHVFWALAIGMGLARLFAALTEARRRWLMTAAAAMIAATPPLYAVLPPLLRGAGATDQTFGIPLVGADVRDGLAFYVNPNRRGDYSASRFGREVLASLPPRAVVLAEFYADTDEYFVLSYFTEVQGFRPDVEIVGWPLVDPFGFDPRLAVDEVDRRIAEGRPVYLASLSEEYYAISELQRRYRIAPENNLYRVLPAP